MGSTIRCRFNAELKESLKSKDTVTTSTVRLILAALKDRDIAARGQGKDDGLSDDEILSMLQTMVKQRKESIKMYNEGGREELAQREQDEITVIERFLPKQMSDDEIHEALKSAIEETGAEGMKDMGKVMGLMKSKYPGVLDMGKASGMVRGLLA
jgi:hypothetical protein